MLGVLSNAYVDIAQHNADTELVSARVTATSNNAGLSSTALICKCAVMCSS